MRPPVDPRQAAVVILAFLALVSTLFGLPAPVGTLLTFPFVLVGPGLAVGAVLRLRDPLLEVALVIPFSLAVQTLLATLVVYLELYSAPLVLIATLIVSLAALAVDARMTRTAPRPPPIPSEGT